MAVTAPDVSNTCTSIDMALLSSLFLIAFAIVRVSPG
jgi:hypothetical protein